ncbi:MAG TPA: carboxypeptidase-like regulatory domain-containing protein [Gemmatimonadales bacterium]|nr:carboxypeptidase-like regulatory domain-containing protein [Gemmatimonadales bacterium]
MRQDTIPVPGVRVTLHRVGRVRQGPVDSMVTDARGRFDFRFVPDTTAVYLLSAHYAGIEYFSEPVHTNPEKPDTGLSLEVSDTSARQRLEVEARHLVVDKPASDGTRRVVDLVVLRNPGPDTRVASDSTQPTWSMPLPPGAIGFEVGQSDVGPAALVREGDVAQLLAPLPPGERQLVMFYALPSDAATVTVPMPGPVDMLNLLLEEPAATAEAPGLARADTAVIEGRTFRRWTGKLAAGATLRLTLPSARRAPAWTLAALVTGFATLLAFGAWFLARRRREGEGAPAGVAPAPALVPPAEADAGSLLDALAALDARYRGQEGEVAAEEWARYETERARLKARLQAALAGGSRRP